MGRLGPPGVRASAAALALAAIVASRGALAAGTPEVGFVDQTALAALPSFAAANARLVREKTALDVRFTAEMRGATSAADQARISQSYQQRFLDRQHELLGPLLERAQNAIATVARGRKLGIVLDKQIVIVGGENLTPAVTRVLAASGAVAAPSGTPPPSSVVAYVDQTQLDQAPALRAANDAFVRFQAGREAEARRKLERAQTDAGRAAVMKAYEAAILAERARAVDPVVARTRAAIGAVAERKGLALVVDRSSLVYGGTDITSDVASAIK